LVVDVTRPTGSNKIACTTFVSSPETSSSPLVCLLDHLDRRWVYEEGNQADEYIRGEVFSAAGINAVTRGNGTIPAMLPVRLKLVRTGSTYTGSSSANGSTWSPVGSVTVCPHRRATGIGLGHRHGPVHRFSRPPAPRPCEVTHGEPGRSAVAPTKSLSSAAGGRASRQPWNIETPGRI